MSVGVHRTIILSGAIDEDTYKEFSENLLNFEIEDDNQSIIVEITSGGGSAEPGMAFYGRMRMSPCNIITRVYGYANSAASVVFLAGDERQIHEDAIVMIHDDTVAVKAARVDLATSDLRRSHQVEVHWAKLFASRTNKPYKFWRKKSYYTTYLSPADCLETGLATEVLK